MEATTDTDDMGRTSIQVTDELADELHNRKGRGESYEDVIWSLIEKAEGESALPERDDTDTPPSRDALEGDHSGEGLETVEFPAGRDRDECERAVRAARDYLKENGPASMREIVAEVMPRHPLGYEVPELESGERYRGAWWRKVVKPGLEALEDVDSPPKGASNWSVTGDDPTEGEPYDPTEEF